MNFLKNLFGSKEESPEERKAAEKQREFDILKHDGVKALHTQQYQQAERCFLSALERKEDPEIRDYLSQTYLALQAPQKAYKELEKMAEYCPGHINIFIRMAQVAYTFDAYDMMTDACQNALTIDTNRPEVHYLYAQAYLGQDSATKAIEYLTRAIELKEDYAEAYLLRGQTYLQNSCIEEAEKDATWLLQEYEENEEVAMLYAKIQLQKGDDDEAEKVLTRVIENNPFHIEAYQERCKLYQRLGNEEAAQQDQEAINQIEANLADTSDNENHTAIPNYQAENPFS